MLHLKQQYTGYLNTPSLWQNSLIGLKQFNMDLTADHTLDVFIKEGLMLGKRAERFFENYIKHKQEYSIVLANKQINHEQLTLGEFDFILAKNEQFFHVECVYKFYLFNPTIITKNALEGWVGPNCKDFLVKKLDKLKHHQLPLLFNEHAKPILNAYDIPLNAITQQVSFKAQLFINSNLKLPAFQSINKNCVAGFWMYYDHFMNSEHFKNYKFYIPKKHDWFILPDTHVSWLSYKDFTSLLSGFINEKRSPLCWFKNPKGLLEKGFVVWW